MSSKVPAGFLDMWVASLGGYDIWDFANVISRYCRILTLDVARLFLSGIQPKRCLQLCDGLRFSKRIAQNPHLWLSNKKHYQVIHVKICCKLLNLRTTGTKPTAIWIGVQNMSSSTLLIQRLQKGRPPCMTSRGWRQSASQIMEAEIVGGNFLQLSVSMIVGSDFVLTLFWCIYFPIIF